MSRLQLNSFNEVVIPTSLSDRQISKFNTMQDSLVIRNGMAYLSTNDLYGVLLTRGRDDARLIVKRYKDDLRIYFVKPDRLGLYDRDEPEYILPVGIYILLEFLARDRPQRAHEYRASHAFLACIVAGHPQLAIYTSIRGQMLSWGFCRGDS